MEGDVIHESKLAEFKARIMKADVECCRGRNEVEGLSGVVDGIKNDNASRPSIGPDDIFKIRESRDYTSVMRKAVEGKREVAESVLKQDKRVKELMTLLKVDLRGKRKRDDGDGDLEVVEESANRDQELRCEIVCFFFICFVMI